MATIADMGEVLLSPSFIEDPYPKLHEFRDSEPVLWSSAVGGWVLTGTRTSSPRSRTPTHTAVPADDPRPESPRAGAQEKLTAVPCSTTRRKGSSTPIRPITRGSGASSSRPSRRLRSKRCGRRSSRSSTNSWIAWSRADTPSSSRSSPSRSRSPSSRRSLAFPGRMGRGSVAGPTTCSRSRAGTSRAKPRCSGRRRCSSRHASTSPSSSPSSERSRTAACCRSSSRPRPKATSSRWRSC